MRRIVRFCHRGSVARLILARVGQRNEIQRTFDTFGGSAGMLKHSGSWYRDHGEVTTVLNLQKSQYGLRYYVNIGLWLHVIGEATFPPERECHVRLRLDALATDTYETEKLLDLGSDVPEGERGRRLSALLQSIVGPFLERVATVEGVREMGRQGLLRAAAIRGPALRVLEIEQ
jgi:hypothetical protein